jgi:hypothetical protein
MNQSVNEKSIIYIQFCKNKLNKYINNPYSQYFHLFALNSKGSNTMEEVYEEFFSKRKCAFKRQELYNKIEKEFLYLKEEN